MKPNIIFVLLDGARWDRLSKSEEFQEISKNGTLLNNVSTAMPYTIGSINVTFSGLYGKENGIEGYHKMLRLKKTIKNFPEIFQSQGYFTACDVLTDKIIPDRGFDIHQVHDEFNDNLFEKHPKFIKKCIEKAEGKPLFLFLYFSKIHTITVSEVLKKYEWNDKKFYENKEENMERYDSGFKQAGKYSKLILEELKENNLEENTIVVFFSDHGTGIGERFGERNYGVFTYEETIRTFYLFIGDFIAKNKKSDSLLQTIDILPTILDLCKIKTDINLDGRSFSSFLKNNDDTLADANFTFSETGGLQGPFPSPKEPNVFCIKSPTFKLIYYKSPNKWELFNLENDPMETNNLSEKGLTIEQELKETLLAWIDRKTS